MRLPQHHTAATIATPRVVRVLGADARLAENDEPDATERQEIARGFAIAAGHDPDEVQAMRNGGLL